MSTVLSLDAEDAFDSEQHLVKLVADDGAEIVDLAVARFFDLVNASLTTSDGDHDIDEDGAVVFPVGVKVQSLRALLDFFHSHFLQLRSCQSNDQWQDQSQDPSQIQSSPTEQKKEKEDDLSWLLVHDDFAAAVLHAARTVAQAPFSEGITDALNDIHNSLPEAHEWSGQSYCLESSLSHVQNLASQMKDPAHSTASTSSMFPNDALCYISRKSMTALDQARIEYHASMLLIDADLRDKFAADTQPDCRVRHATDPSIPICFLCRTWNASDLPVAMQLLYDIYYLGVPAKLQNVLQAKTIALLNRTLEMWSSRFGSDDDACLASLLQSVGFIQSGVITKFFGCTHNATIYGDERVVAVSDSTDPDVQLVVGKEGVDRRMDFLACVLHVSMGWDKHVLKRLFQHHSMPIHHLCDLVENALLNGYSITGSREAQVKVILEEPFRSTIVQLLRSIFMPLEDDPEEQEKRWNSLAVAYQRLFWDNCRADLMKVFGISVAHQRHFLEAPTLRKFVVWHSAGADIDVPIVSVDEAILPFQVETRSMDQIIQDQKAKRQQQIQKEAQDKLRRIREQRGAAKKTTKASSSVSATVALSRPASAPRPPRLPVMPTPTSASPMQLQKARARALQQNLQQAQEDLKQFDIRTAASDDTEVWALAALQRREKANTIAILEAAMRQLYKKRDTDLDLIKQRAALVRTWEQRFLKQRKLKAT